MEQMKAPNHLVRAERIQLDVCAVCQIPVEWEAGRWVHARRPRRDYPMPAEEEREGSR